MADILIRGMEMPENDPLRILLYKNGQLHVDHGVYYDEFEAVELPEHGDLIDRSEIKTNMVDEVLGNKVSYVNMEQIKNAPVVVPSNKEESNGD